MALSTDDVAALSRLFDAVEGLAPPARETWLAALPPAQRHLLPLLRQMLATQRGGSAHWPLPDLVADAPAPGRQGVQIGPYRLIRQLGRGGMGSVWLAERADGQFDRRVALKLPRLPALTRGLDERLALERQIGARLEHPHIARLYDAGVHLGAGGPTDPDAPGAAQPARQPYLAFEYIAGQQIDHWCQAHAGHVERSLRVFVQVLRALAYAHRQLVVHRDVKPANILVDASGRAVLLDFGIAKLLEDAASPSHQVTQEFGVPMTRRYASPEQIAGLPVGTASDVYACGVTLYEVLTGSSPYQLPRDTAAALDQAIAQGDIAPASSRVQNPWLRRRLQGDLDAMLWKALQRKPEQRYPSADAMADDIERYLAGQAISVRHAPWLERSRRFARRHRAGLLVALGMALAGCSMLGVVLQQTQRTAEEAERARLLTEFTAGLFRLQALPARPPAGATGATGADRPTAHPVISLIDLGLSSRPDVQADLYGAIAQVYTDIGVGKLAADLAARQVAVLKQSAQPAERQVRALLLLARAHGRSGRHADALQAARDAVALAPDSVSDAGLDAHAALAARLLPGGRMAEARAIFAAVNAARPVAQRRPSVALARLLDAQGALMEIDNRFDEAVALWLRAVAMATAVEGPDSRTAATIRLRMASELLGRNRATDARTQLDLALASLNRLGDSGQAQAALAAAKYTMEAFAMGLMPPAEATTLLDAAHATVAAWGTALPEEVLARVDVARGVLALRRQELARAAALLEQAVPIARRATDGLIDRRWLASHLAGLAMATGQHERADALLQQRRDLRIQAGNGATPYAAFDWVMLSQNALMRGDLAAARAVLQGAPSFKALTGDQHASGLAYAHASAEQWARIHLQEGQPAAALAVMPTPYGLAPAEDLSEPTLAPHALRGEVLCAAGQAAQGLPYLLASTQALEAVLVPEAPALARLRAQAGRCALALGDRAAAQRLADLARAAWASTALVSPWYRRPLTALEAELGVELGVEPGAGLALAPQRARRQAAQR